ncbi:MAG: tripartite tricarboxylate transporter substrate-binding protein [Burkholderiaceae bacterium]
MVPPPCTAAGSRKSSAAAFIRSGEVKALAVTPKQRLASQPDASMVAESGHPSYES